MNRTHSLLSFASASALALLLACGGGGGGGSTPPALSYTDPASGTWQLKKNASSTGSHLVLDLVANGAGTGAGVALVLNADSTRVQWSQPTGGDTQYVHNVLFSLGSGTQALKGKVSGGTLQVAVSEKGFGTAKTLNGTVAQIALDMKSGAPGGAATLSVVSGKTKVVSGPSTVSDITVSIGSLAVQ